MSNDVNKIIVWTNPTAPFQKVYVMKEGVLIDQLGVKVEDVEDVVFALMDKHGITQIDFSGAVAFAEHFGKNIQEANVTKYGARDLIINYL